MQGTVTDDGIVARRSGLQSPKNNGAEKRSQHDAQAAAQVIESINETLAEKVGQQKYRIWFKNSTQLTLTEGYLKVSVPNPFISNWIENHFLNEIREAVQSITGVDVQVIFAINPDLAGRQRQARTRKRRMDDGRIVSRPSSKGGYQTKKLKFHLDTFVVGSSNELAYNAAKVIVNEQQTTFNPLFVHGGHGVGKTHLLQGICNAVCEKRPQTHWLYLSAEDFANQFVLALKTKKLEAFRRRMRQTDLLAIDDIHFLASKPSMQEEFLHTFNTISLAGKQVILASDAHPKTIGQLSEKLVNRFVSGMVAKISNPDFETRCRICLQYLKTQKIKLKHSIPENVVRHIAENLHTNVRELEGALLKLIAFSALKNEKITVSMANAILAEHLERCDPIVHVSDIESVVAAYFGITPATLHSSKKNRTVALARHFSMYLTRKHTKMSSSEIGRVMGNKNHATVLLACKKIEEMTKRNAELRWQGPAGNKVSKTKTVLAQLEESISK